MSGGSHNYAYSRVDDMAGVLRKRAQTPLRVAFAKHLELVAKAMYAVEWVDSGDWGPGDEVEAIQKVLSKGAELEAALELAQVAQAHLESVIERAKKSQNKKRSD